MESGEKGFWIKFLAGKLSVSSLMGSYFTSFLTLPIAVFSPDAALVGHNADMIRNKGLCTGQLVSRI